MSIIINITAFVIINIWLLSYDQHWRNYNLLLSHSIDELSVKNLMSLKTHKGSISSPNF